MTYPDYPETPVRLEDAVLELWRSEDLFRRTLERTEGGEPFVFYEGPPTANGRPGIHHVLSRTIKDAVCRFRAMQGRHVTRIAGWDTHGLPVEIEAEKKLGISGKRQIEEVGVARFNEVCRESVFTYQEDWERLSERIGYWLDYSRPYVTYRPEYIESVWWIIETLASKGLLYRGYKSVAYCPRCGTALSSHEVAQGYEDVEDPSIYVIAPLRAATDRDAEADPGRAGGPGRRAFLLWTTTPWTLPANAALAVHPDFEYAEVAHGAWRLIVAAARVEALFGEDAEVVARHRGSDLIGLRYERPFDLLEAEEPGESAWTVVAEEFVTAEDGTGIVHMAPAFGADDFASGQKHGLPLLRPLDDAARFHEAIGLVGGLFVKEADDVLAEDLRARGLVFRYGKERHTYPHCWRCGSPLIYMARDSWYLRTTAYRDRMLENNAAIGWHPPEVGSGRMGEWLAGNIDWALSRERYWGTPLPVWVCDADESHVEVIGSFAKLADRAGPLPEDFDPHKPTIDELAWDCADCGGTMRRTPEVIDVWFDSGSMPYAQWHYPFENEEAWKAHFPADFICEGVDQTRGWFYSLLAIGTMLDLGPTYRNVVVNDLVLDAEGQKMSKSRGNVADPWEAIARHGADAIRWYLLTVSQAWVPKRFDAEALAEASRRVFDTLANTYRFFALYANLEAWSASDADPAPAERPVLDRWVLARMTSLVEQVNRDLEAYELTRAYRAVGDFIVDDLSNWYVRRSRDRFWGAGDRADARAAFRTLADVLATVARLLAPLTPFVADWLHRAVAGGSVHLAPFPTPDASLADPALEQEMAAARVLARLGRAAREQARIRVRQPLRTLYAVGPRGRTVGEELRELLRDELNVKEIRFLEQAGDIAVFKANPNFRTLGPRFGQQVNAVAGAIRALPSETVQRLRAGESVDVAVGDRTVVVEPADVEVRQEAVGGLLVEADEGYTVALDPTVDDELRLEGLARELVNRIQRLRRDSGLEVQDRIRLGLAAPAELQRAVQSHAEWIRGETLAVDLEIGTNIAEDAFGEVGEVDVDGLVARIGLNVVRGEQGRAEVAR